MNSKVGSPTIPTFMEIKNALVFGSRLYKNGLRKRYVMYLCTGFTLFIGKHKFWENRSNTLTSEKWNADITPAPINLPASHIVFELFLYHTIYDFLCRVYTRSVLLSSCITLPYFLLVFCLTSYSTKGYVSHKLFWSIPVFHSVQFFLGLILAISLLCRLVFCCIRKPHPR